ILGVREQRELATGDPPATLDSNHLIGMNNDILVDLTECCRQFITRAWKIGFRNQQVVWASDPPTIGLAIQPVCKFSAGDDEVVLKRTHCGNPPERAEWDHPEYIH